MALQPILNMRSNSVIAPGPTGWPSSISWMVSIRRVVSVQQAQPRQVAQQAAQHAPGGSRGDDLQRDCRRGPGRRKAAVAAASAAISARHCRRTAAASPRNTGAEHLFDGLLPASKPSAGRRRPAHHRADQAAGVGRSPRAAAMICSSSVSLMLRRRSYSTSDSACRGATECGSGATAASNSSSRRRLLMAWASQPESTSWRSAPSPPAAVRGHGGHLPQLRQRGQERQPQEDPLGFRDQLEIGRVLAPFQHFAFEAVVGAVAIGHVLVGGVEDVVFVLVVVRVPRAFAGLRSRRRPARTPAPASMLGVGFQVIEKLPRQRPAVAAAARRFGGLAPAAFHNSAIQSSVRS